MTDIASRCEGCVFAELENEQQIGCSLGRADKLGIADIENNFYNLSRFCVTYRPKAWLEDLQLSESLDTKKTVMLEVQPRVGFFVYFEKSLDDLKRVVEDIKNQEIKARYIVVINSYVEYNNEIQEILESNFDFNETEHHIVQLIEEPKNRAMVIDESFKHAKNGWVYFCHASESIDRDLIQKINKRVNVDLKKLVFVHPYDDNYNGLMFQASLFKFLNGNSTKVFKDSSTDKGSFVDKVKEAAKKSDKETFITWSEFNES